MNKKDYFGIYDNDRVNASGIRISKYQHIHISGMESISLTHFLLFVAYVLNGSMHVFLAFTRSISFTRHTEYAYCEHGK